MITQDNITQYQTLFDKVNGLMGYGDNEKIVDINDYFTALRDIKNNVVNKVKDFDPYFLILPNDEGLFAINANTREIEVPSIFKTGIGVQGDELAEIVYFSVDRYFDTTDLYDKDIFVQWEAPNGDKGLSVTINKTLLFEPGKVVFGWPIVSEMTKQPGYLKFAVRFYEREVNENGTAKLIYSFSTLTNQVKINPGLDFTIDTKEDEQIYGLIDKNATIYKMMRNSSGVVADIPAAMPVFDSNAYTPNNFEQSYNVGEVFEGKVLFEDKAEEPAKGNISYIWHKKDKKGNDATIDGQHIIYKPTQDTARNPVDQYFTKDEQDKYHKYSGAIPPEDSKITLYKLYASYAPKAAGSYYVIASNNAGRGNTVESEKSKIWQIAYPNAPIITYPEGIKNTIMHGDSITLALPVEGNGQLTYQWSKSDKKETDFTEIEGATQSSLTITKKENNSQEGYYKVEVTNSKNAVTEAVNSESIRVTLPASELPAPSELLYYANDQVYNIQYGATKGSKLKVIIQDSLDKSDNLTYQWYYAPSNPPEFTPLSDGNINETYTANQTGYYKVKITNTYNLDKKEVESNPFIVN